MDNGVDTRPGPGDPTIAAALLRADPSSAGVIGSSEALHAIRIHLGMEVAFLSEFVDGQRVFRAVDAASEHCPVQVGGSDPLEDSYCQRVVDGRLPELMHDAGAHPAAAELSVTAELPVGAHLSVPVRLADGAVYGTFCCFSATPDHSLNQRDLAVMRVFADLTAAHIDRDLERRRREAATLGRLWAAIAGKGLSMVFQPIVDIDAAQPVGFEALARFSLAPARGPAAWFAEAAAAGLGTELELTAVGAALRRIGQLAPGTYLSVNVSPSTVVSGRLEALLRDVPVDRVVLEITEHAMVGSDQYEHLDAALGGLRRRGLRVAVDDAGAGYASFRHILRLEPDIIKLDMTLTRDIDRNRGRAALASALIAFAHDTDCTIVAEGVETAGELRTLRRLGVTTAQGYHLARPSTSCGVDRAALTRV